MVTCSNGHRAYAGYVDEAAYLSERVAWLDQRIAAGDPPPDVATAQRYGVWPARPAAEATEVPAPAAPGGHGSQTVLLTLGAGLLVVAGLVFTAVVWKRLGSAGQVSLLAGVTVAVAFAAVRLVRRLPSTAEALAAVAFGLAAIDAVTAPALGLLPDGWLHQNSPYPTILCLVLAAAGVTGGRRTRLRSWVWLGWVALALAAGLASQLVAHTIGDGRHLLAAASVGIVAVTAVALLAAPHLSVRLHADRGPLTTAGGFAAAWTVIAWAVYWVDLDRLTIAGLALTALGAAAAAAAVWYRSRLPWPATAALVLAALSAGLALAVLPGQRSYWLPVVVGAAGIAVLAGVRLKARPRDALLTAAVLWAAWALVRVVVDGGGPPDAGLHRRLAVLACLVAATWFAVAAAKLEPAMAWPAALVGGSAWLLTGLAHRALEPRTLPLAALLLLAGILWRRTEAATSTVWLGPAVVTALVPSALATWAAPWVTDLTEQTTARALLRLVAVLVASALAVAAGARWHLLGLLVPGTVALGVVAGAQVWSGLAASPRWVAIALVGAALIIAGARLEWLRGQGRDFRRYVGTLQ